MGFWREVGMRSALLVLVWTQMCAVSCRLHTLRYFHTSTSPKVPDLPEFVSDGFVDDVQITHYDSDTGEYVPKQEWMNRITEDDPDFWERNWQLSMANEQVGKSQIETVKQRLNVTGGVHVLQFMSGCDWDDETDEITGYFDHAFDGEDFIKFDYATETFVAPRPEAFITKLKWQEYGIAAHQKYYISHDCVKYLKIHVKNGESALQRTELPLVSLLQTSSSSRVTCHATGFYGDKAKMFWTKDGDKVMEDIVDTGQILPNRDGTFQISVSLDLSSVPPQDWDRFYCVFQLSGVKDDYVTKLDRTNIRTNERSYILSISAVMIALIVVLTVVAAFIFLRKRKGELLKPPQSEIEEPQEKNDRLLKSQ